MKKKKKNIYIKYGLKLSGQILCNILENDNLAKFNISAGKLCP